MFGTILKEAAIVFIFCNIFVGGEEFLEYYKPKPGLPKELNAWLANVQKYKKDFRLIRAIADDANKFGRDVDEDEEESNGKELIGNLKDDYLDYGPKNDIYPNVYKRKNRYPRATPEKRPRRTKSTDTNSNPSRLRRHSDTNSFFERRHDIAVNPKSTNGEVKRSDDKYPDRYSNGLNKRDIQIDVLNNGKLVKQFRDSDQDPKSIVLSFQQPEQENNPLPPLVAAGAEKINNKPQQFDSPLKIYTPRSPIDLDNVPAKSKEYSSNFKNLFYANENLNTDSSIARDNLAKTALVYRVTLPDPNFLYQAPSESSSTEKTDSTPSFNNNGFKDMSHFWTISEKNQLQKGIDFAQNPYDRRVPPRPQQQPQRPVDNDGFELVKSLVVDSDGLANKPKAIGNTPPNVNKAPNVPNKRESETLEGEVNLDSDKKGNCAGGKCSGIVHLEDVKTDRGAVDRGERFDVEANVFENETPTSITIIDFGNGVDNLENGARPVEMDHQMPPRDQVDELDEKGMESPLKEDVQGGFLENENSGGKVTELDSPEEHNQLCENPETLPGSAIGDSVQEPPPVCGDTEAQNLDSCNTADMSVEHLDAIEPSHEINVEINKDVSAPTFQKNCETKKHHRHNNPLTKIHKLDQHMDEHIVVTRIETVTILDQEQAQHINHDPTNCEHPSYEEQSVDHHADGEHPVHEEHLVHDEHFINEDHPVHQEHLVNGEHPVHEDHPVHEEHLVHDEHFINEDHPVHQDHHVNGEHPVHDDHPVHEEHLVHEEHSIHEDHPDHQEHFVHEECPVHEEHPVHEVHIVHEEQPVEEEQAVNGEHNMHEEHQIHEEHSIHEDQPMNEEHEEVPVHGEEHVHGDHHHENHPLHVQCHLDEKQHGNEQHGEHHVHGENPVDRDISAEQMADGRSEPTSSIGDDESDDFKSDVAGGRTQGVYQRQGREEISNSEQSSPKTVRFFPKASVKQREQSWEKVSPDRKMVPSNQYKIQDEVRPGRVQEYRGSNFPNAVRHCNQGICLENAIGLESERNPGTPNNLAEEKSRSEFSHPIVYDRKLPKHNHKKKHTKKKHKIRRRPHTEGMEYWPDSKEHEDYPTYSKRQLQSVDYVYDVDLESPKEEYPGGMAKGTTKRSQLLHKNSVEGDYGDEEDSMTSKKKKGSSKLVKKTENEFANPVSTTTEAEDDDEYYNEIANVEANKKEKADEANVNKLGLQSKDEKLKFREPRNLPNQKFLESSEFQQWPQFVRNDQINEENLRRRSVNRKTQKKNNFPLAAKDYFQKSEPRRGELDKLADEVTKADGGGSITQKTTKDAIEEKITFNLYLDDKGKTNGNDDTPPRGGQTHSGHREDECETSKVMNVCEENENFNRTKVAITTVLSIENRSGSNVTFPPDHYEKLDEILSGHLPLRIIDGVRSHVQEYRFIKDMKKSPPKDSFEDLQDLTNQENRKLINAMARIMNRLQLTTTCQTIPLRLLRYLKSITKMPGEDALSKTKQMEEVEFDDAQNQDQFIFQSNVRGDRLEAKVRVLKDLLMKFHHLPDRCKPRAEPVREYIQNHLKMLNSMIAGSEMFDTRPKKTLPQRSEPEPNHPTTIRSGEERKKDLVEEQLESLGLGRRHNFKPRFDLNELVEHNKISEASPEESSPKKNKRQSDFKRDISEKYGKLMNAVERKRSKRRVAETFGRLSLDDFNGASGRREVRDSFESPVVFSF